MQPTTAPYASREATTGPSEPASRRRRRRNGQGARPTNGPVAAFRPASGPAVPAGQPSRPMSRPVAEAEQPAVRRLPDVARRTGAPTFDGVRRAPDGRRRDAAPVRDGARPFANPQARVAADRQIAPARPRVPAAEIAPTTAHAPLDPSVAASPPTPAASFDEMALRPAIRSVVAAMGITTPTPIQAQAIPVMLGGHDVVGQARTGSGKTLAFGLPLVERCDPALRGVQALVLVPTRELALQVGEVLGQLARARRLRLTLLYGGRSLVPETRALASGAQIVVGTPGRTLDHLRQGNLSLQRLRIFVLDEGDEMLDRGFAPDVERILGYTPSTRQTALFSATVPLWVMETAARHLRNPVTVRVDPTAESPAEIEHVVYDVDPADRLDALCTLLDRRGDGPIIVFGRTKHGVKKLAQKLERLGYPVGALQGNLSQNARERVMAEFRAGRLSILLATNVAARGLDIDGVAQVINFELPESSQLFTHRVGRTGRMGRQGEAITFVTPEEAPKWRQIERALGRSLPRKPWPAQRGGTPPAAPASPTPAPATAPVPASPAERRRPQPWRGPQPPATPRSEPAPRSKAAASRRWRPRRSQPRP